MQFGIDISHKKSIQKTTTALFSLVDHIHLL